MADISKINIRGTEYNLKDAWARSQITSLAEAGLQFYICTAAANIPKGVKAWISSAEVTGTLEASTASTNPGRGYVYLVPVKTSAAVNEGETKPAKDIYEEWVVVNVSTTSTPSWQWELLGNTGLSFDGLYANLPETSVSVTPTTIDVVTGVNVTIPAHTHALTTEKINVLTGLDITETITKKTFTKTNITPAEANGTATRITASTTDKFAKAGNAAIIAAITTENVTIVGKVEDPSTDVTYVESISITTDQVLASSTATYVALTSDTVRPAKTVSFTAIKSVTDATPSTVTLSKVTATTDVSVAKAATATNKDVLTSISTTTETVLTAQGTPSYKALDFGSIVPAKEASATIVTGVSSVKFKPQITASSITTAATSIDVPNAWSVNIAAATVEGSTVPQSVTDTMPVMAAVDATNEILYLWPATVTVAKSSTELYSFTAVGSHSAVTDLVAYNAGSSASFDVLTSATINPSFVYATTNSSVTIVKGLKNTGTGTTNVMIGIGSPETTNVIADVDGTTVTIYNHSHNSATIKGVASVSDATVIKSTGLSKIVTAATSSEYTLDPRDTSKVVLTGTSSTDAAGTGVVVANISGTTADVVVGVTGTTATIDKTRLHTHSSVDLPTVHSVSAITTKYIPVNTYSASASVPAGTSALTSLTTTVVDVAKAASSTVAAYTGFTNWTTGDTGYFVYDVDAAVASATTDKVVKTVSVNEKAAVAATVSCTTDDAVKSLTAKVAAATIEIKVNESAQ